MTARRSSSPRNHLERSDPLLRVVGYPELYRAAGRILDEGDHAFKFRCLTSNCRTKLREAYFPHISL